MTVAQVQTYTLWETIVVHCAFYFYTQHDHYIWVALRDSTTAKPDTQHMAPTMQELTSIPLKNVPESHKEQLEHIKNNLQKLELKTQLRCNKNNTQMLQLKKQLKYIKNKLQYSCKHGEGSTSKRQSGIVVDKHRHISKRKVNQPRKFSDETFMKGSGAVRRIGFDGMDHDYGARVVIGTRALKWFGTTPVRTFHLL